MTAAFLGSLSIQMHIVEAKEDTAANIIKRRLHQQTKPLALIPSVIRKKLMHLNRIIKYILIIVQLIWC